MEIEELQQRTKYLLHEIVSELFDLGMDRVNANILHDHIEDLLGKHKIRGGSVIEPIPVTLPKDQLFDKAVKVVKKFKSTGETVTARWLHDNIGTTLGRASMLIDQLEAAGIISPKEDGKPRRVL